MKKATGEHYTPTMLADFVAQQIIDALEQKAEIKSIRALDPATGNGELLISLLQQLPGHSLSNVNIHGFETNPEAARLAQARLCGLFPNVPIDIRCENFLDFVLRTSGQEWGDLFAHAYAGFYDIVIANPPYVRTQALGAQQAQSLARQFGLSGRVDLYYAFIQAIARVLRPGGFAGLIVSNRFMTTKSGAAMRQSIHRDFDVLHVWDLGDTRIFEAAVLPAILLLKKKNGQVPRENPKFTSIYSTTIGAPESHCTNIIAALSKLGVIQVEDGDSYLVRHGKMDHGGLPSGVWRIATETSDEWLATVNAHTYCTFGDIGKIRVGVKTTADKVFIRSDWADMPESERPEILRPLTTHLVARRFKGIQPIKEQILYTHRLVQGKRLPVNLAEFPRAARYLNGYRSVLEKRQYVLQAGRNWFEIWVPQDPEAWTQPKIVFRDITERPTFWMDLDGSVVNGDCYWLACKNPEQAELLWLALAVGNSSFIEAFYDYCFNNKLYAGRRRFITQYVEKFPLPAPNSTIAKTIIRVVKLLYALIPSSEAYIFEKVLDQLVWQAFGLPAKETVR